MIDKTRMKRLKAIDSVAASSWMLECSEGHELLEHNEVIESDHWLYVFSAALEEYFNETLDNYVKFLKMKL